jgi:hypothetical protein
LNEFLSSTPFRQANLCELLERAHGGKTKEANLRESKKGEKEREQERKRVKEKTDLRHGSGSVSR